MECKRCGTCCEKGGPVLHVDDMAFLKKGIVSMDQLQVIRKGELAFNPFKELVEPVPLEMIKLASGESWECPFHQKIKGCSGCEIHTNRPMECRLLKCWDTKDIQAVTYNDCLSRFDLLGLDNDIRAELLEHENRCSYSELWRLISGVTRADAGSLKPVQRILSTDLEIHQKLVADFHLNLQQELFYCGQPMFRVIREEAFSVSFTGDLLTLSFKD